MKAKFVFESINELNLDNILDKISSNGIDSLTNIEQKFLKSYSDKSIDITREIENRNKRYKLSKDIISKEHGIGLQRYDRELSKNIGRYCKWKPSIYYKNPPKEDKWGIIYEIVDTQTHWGYNKDGEYVPDKIGYRVIRVGKENDFGKPLSVDNCEFINIDEKDAIQNNKIVFKKIDDFIEKISKNK